MADNEHAGKCIISLKQYPATDLIAVSTVHEPLLGMIKKKSSEWNDKGFISVVELNKVRNEYVMQSITDERGELGELEREVVDSIKNVEFISKNIYDETDSSMTFGQRIADKVAAFGGSWAFIGIFFVILVAWMGVNTTYLLAKPFDPYPYIFLNLVLSCLAAIQAPVIMMSQNRQEDKDRVRAAHDYQVNLKAELEIRTLHEKVDHLLLHQQQRLLHIQQMQMDMLQTIMERVDSGK